MKNNFLCFFIFSFVQLWSAPIDDFNQVIKETNINQKRYEHISFDNLKNNQTQQEAKALFEQILPYYLETQTLFSKERLERVNREQILLDGQDRRSTIPTTREEFDEIEKNYYKNMTMRSIHYYSIFFEMLHSYIKNVEGDAKKGEELAQKALDDMVKLIENSVESIDYMYGLLMLEKIYKWIDTRELLEIFPPPRKVLLYQKIEQDKRNNLDRFRVPRCTERLTKQENRRAMAYMDAFADKIENGLNPRTKHYIEVFRNGSKKELEQLKIYHKKEKEKLDTKKWNDSKVKLSLILSMLPNIDAIVYIQELQKKLDKTYGQKLEELDSKNSLWGLYLWYAFLGLFFFYLVWMFLTFLRWLYGKIGFNRKARWTK